MALDSSGVSLCARPARRAGRRDRPTLHWHGARSAEPVVARRRSSRRSSSSIGPTGRRSPRRCRSPLRETEIVQLRGLGEPLDPREVAEVYLPLSRLLNLYVGGTKSLHEVTSEFLRERVESTPFVIGVAGSVAVGKSTIARLLRELLARWEHTPRVELVTTDGFLFPNAELERRGLMERKGFPESYDRRALLRFVSEVKAGAAEVRAPFYSHLAYDIVPDAQITVRRPDVLIVEGLNVLQPPRPGPPPRGERPVRLHDLRRRPHERHRPLVRGALPEAAARRVREPALVLPPLREPHRGRGAPARARDLAVDQRAEPAAEHPARRGRARRSCCARAPTTPSRACCCASSEQRRADAPSTATSGVDREQRSGVRRRGARARRRRARPRGARRSPARLPRP